MNHLVKMDLDFGKQGVLQSMFICTLEDLETLYGKWADFGEALGKHSSIECMLDNGDFSVICLPLDSVDAIQEACGKSVCGYNPFNYVTP